MTTFINESTTRRLVGALLALGMVLGAGATRAQAVCLCDSYRGEGGTTGSAVLAQLCPRGVRGSGVSFQDDVRGFTLISWPPALGYVALAYEASEVESGSLVVGCALKDGRESGLVWLKLRSPRDAADCRAHLRARCGQ